jgi:hypothetical protein
LETEIIINRDVLFNEVLDAKSTTEVFPDEETSANKHKLENEVGITLGSSINLNTSVKKCN